MQASFLFFYYTTKNFNMEIECVFYVRYTEYTYITYEKMIAFTKKEEKDDEPSIH